MEFISRNWGGHDYIPRVWDEWMKEGDARTFVVEVDGKPVGMNRVKFLEDGSAWLEGARVHPDYRGAGLATSLGENSIRHARKHGRRVVRLVTNSHNHSALRQIARMGFRETTRMSVYVPKKRARLSLQRGVRLAKAADLKRIEASVVNSQEFRFGGGVYWDGFRAVALTHRTIQRLVKERRALLSGEAVAFVKKGEEGREPFRQVCFVCGSPKGMANLIEHVLARGGKRFLERYLCAPQGSRVVAAAKEAGLERWSSYILFQRTSPNG
jgi:GNAT superfamily N-acetyltransferase